MIQIRVFLYLLIKEGDIENTTEVSEDLFVAYDEKKNIVEIELWRARRNLFGEILKYLNRVTELEMVREFMVRGFEQKLMELYEDFKSGECTWAILQSKPE